GNRRVARRWSQVTRGQDVSWGLAAVTDHRSTRLEKDLPVERKVRTLRPFRSGAMKPAVLFLPKGILRSCQRPHLASKVVPSGWTMKKYVIPSPRSRKEPTPMKRILLFSALIFASRLDAEEPIKGPALAALGGPTPIVYDAGAAPACDFNRPRLADRLAGNHN